MRARVRRDEQQRRAEAEASVVAERLLARADRPPGRRDVIEEAAPFIVVDDEQGAVPLRALRYRGVDPVEIVLARADVVVRMIVRSGSGGLLKERRIDEGDVGQRAGGAVGVER